MSALKIINVNHSVYEENDRIAADVRAMNQQSHTPMINLMASPGAGKTTFLLKTISELTSQKILSGDKIGIMEADIDSAVDAEKMAAAGVRTIQVHTGGECAMDAEMTLEALQAFPEAKDLNLLVLENVGNLVCPAETDTGADFKIVLLSVPEGDDKPLKYPLMFQVADLVIITKIDTMGYFNFDMDRVVKNISERNPFVKSIGLSAKTGEGFEEWIKWLKENVLSTN